MDFNLLRDEATKTLFNNSQNIWCENIIFQLTLEIVENLVKISQIITLSFLLGIFVACEGKKGNKLLQPKPLGRSLC